MEEKEKIVKVAPVLNEVQVGEVVLRSNKNSVAELIELIQPFLVTTERESKGVDPRYIG